MKSLERDVVASSLRIRADLRRFESRGFNAEHLRACLHGRRFNAGIVEGAAEPVQEYETDSRSCSSTTIAASFLTVGTRK